MEIISNNQETFENNLKIVEPDKHIEIIQKLLSWVLPKAQQAEPEPQPTIYRISVVDQETKTALEKIVSGDFQTCNDEPGVKLEVSNMKTAEKLANWLNDEPQPPEAQPMEVQPTPQPRRSETPLQHTRSGYRNSRI
jgi:hypothetical protein